MTNILFVSASPRNTESVSRAYEHHARSALARKFPDATITNVDLATEKLSFIDETWFTWNYAPDQRHTLTPAQHAQATRDSQLADQLLAADYVIISSPVYNFNVPAVLKAWIDHVVISGKTFKTEAGKPVGLTTNVKDLIVISASGGPLDVYADRGVDAFRTGLRGFVWYTGIQKMTHFGFIGRNDQHNITEQTKLLAHINTLA